MGNFCSSLITQQRKLDDDQDDWPRNEEEMHKKYFEEYETGSKTPLLEKKDIQHATKRKAELHCSYMLPKLLLMAKAKPHLKILDVGCGSGEITVEVAEMFPEAYIFGIDLSGAVLDTAKVYAESRGVRNVEFVQRSVHDMDEEWSGKFDVVFTHQVVAHLGDRVGGVREMRRVTRKGGLVCMREGDLRTGRFYPDERYRVLQECFGVIVDVHQAGGGAADAGRQLRHWAVQAGFEKNCLKATRSVFRYDTSEGRRAYGGHWPGRCTQGLFAQRAMELGVTSQRLDEYALAWKEWIEVEDGIFAMMHGEVIAEVT